MNSASRPFGKIKDSINFWNLTKLISFLFFIIFLVFPVSSLIISSFQGDEGGFSFENFRMFFTKAYYYKTLFNSLEVSLTVTIISVAIGVPLAYIATRYNIKFKRLINMLIIMSLMSPPFIGAYSWILLLGRNGAITNLFKNIGITFPTIYGFGGMVLVFTLKLFPYVYLYVSGAFSSIDRSLEEAAENLGSTRLRRIRTITLPVVMPSIAAGAIMVFMTSLADFGTPMLLGEGYTTLPVQAYQEYMSEIGGNTHMAGALSVIIIICSTTVLLVQKYLVSRKNYTMSSMRPPFVEVLSKGKSAALTAILLLVSLLAFLPQIVVVITSFIKTNGPVFTQGFSFESYQSIFYKLGTNIMNTFLFAIIAIVFIVVFGMLISYLVVKKKSKSNGLLDILVMFPYVIPGCVLGISLVQSFNNPPLILAGTATIMIISYVIRKMPYTVRSSSAILFQIDSNIEEASINLGVPPLKTFFKITARIMLPGVLSGAILSWISVVNELSSSVILYSGRTATISVAIYTEVVRSSYGTAAALASILTVATIISLIIFNRVSKGKVSVV